MTAEATELRTPTGTYQRLTALKGAQLGHGRTRRFVCALTMPDVFSNLQENPNLTPDMTVVLLMIRPVRRHSYSGQSHFFGIRPDEEVTLLGSYTMHPREEKIPLAPPNLDFLLREISIAEKRQPRLKKR